jgi:hypothetical protein
VAPVAVAVGLPVVVALNISGTTIAVFVIAHKMQP